MRTSFLKYVWVFVAVLGLLPACEDLEDTYSDYTGDGPVQYLTKIYDLQGEPKWLSVLLTWELKLDPGRTAILVEWTDDSTTYSQVIDKDARDFMITGLKNYEYACSVKAIEQKDGEVIGKSIGDPVYVRPFTYASEELSLFSQVVRKAYQVAGKKLFVLFEPWADNLISFQVGYFEKGNASEKFWTVEKVNNLPDGKVYAMIGENVDFTKPINVYRKGRIASIDNMELELQPVPLYFETPMFDAAFAAEVRSRLDLIGEIKQSDINDVEVLDIDYDQLSLVDVLHFPNLKELHLGRNRLLAAGTENAVKSVLTNQEESVVALEAIASELGVKIYHYGNHYFNTVPDFFTAKNQVAELPEFSLLNTAGWDITVNPMDAMGYNSGLANLLQESGAYWSPQASEILRRHIIEIDMKESKRILGFKVGQAMTPPADVQTPDVLDIEFETGSGAWESAAFSKSVTVGTGKGETTIIYLDKSHSVKTAQKIRVTVADKFHKKGYNASYAYVDFYTVVLSSFMVIEGN